MLNQVPIDRFFLGLFLLRAVFGMFVLLFLVVVGEGGAAGQSDGSQGQ